MKRCSASPMLSHTPAAAALNPHSQKNDCDHHTQNHPIRIIQHLGVYRVLLNTNRIFIQKGDSSCHNPQSHTSGKMTHPIALKLKFLHHSIPRYMQSTTDYLLWNHPKRDGSLRFTTVSHTQISPLSALAAGDDGGLPHGRQPSRGKQRSPIGGAVASKGAVGGVR